MDSKKVTINEKEYEIKTISYLQGLEIEEARQSGGLVEASKKMLQFSTGISDEDVAKLSLSEGAELQKAVHEANDLDFQEPTGDA